MSSNKIKKVLIRFPKLKNLEDNTVELLTEKIFYLVNRLGIEFKIG